MLPSVRVAIYDENEETTCVEEALLLRSNAFKQWVVVPLISLLTLFVWPVFLYWRVPMQRDWLYTRVTAGVHTATHIYVRGRDGNQEIVDVSNG